jgi:hypothetical protein
VLAVKRVVGWLSSRFEKAIQHKVKRLHSIRSAILNKQAQNTTWGARDGSILQRMSQNDLYRINSFKDMYWISTRGFGHRPLPARANLGEVLSLFISEVHINKPYPIELAEDSAKAA